MNKKRDMMSMESENKKKIYPVAFLMALVVAVIVFFIMLNIEKNVLSNYEKGTVYVTKEIVPKNQIITEENIDTYFEEANLDVNFIPEHSITDKTELIGLAPYFDMEPKMALSINMFHDVNKVISSMNDPREIGLGTDDLSQSVSGILRAGDYVDIYVVKEEQEKAIMEDNLTAENLVYSNIYINTAFDSSGVMIQNGDKESICQRINILFENEGVYEFYKKISEGKVYVVKHIE